MAHSVNIRQLSLLILGFTDDASPGREQITKNYKTNARLFHPDMGGSCETFRALTLAKEVLDGDVYVEEQREAARWAEQQRQQRAQEEYARRSHEEYQRRQQEQQCKRPSKPSQEEDIPWG